MVMPTGHPKTYEHIPYGTRSDDGSHKLMTVGSGGWTLATLRLRRGRVAK